MHPTPVKAAVDETAMRPSEAASTERRNCELCDTPQSVMRSLVTDIFTYGAGVEAVTLEAQVPVWTCTACGETYTDWEAEERRHEAVCHYLDRPTPQELRHFRELNSLSQDDLARISRFGIASVKRWEAGDQLPSASAAQHLQLLMQPGALSRLRARDRVRAFESSPPQFRTTITERARRDAELFQLRPELDEQCVAA
jgi:YgiT-type zinc finger domain-containing protein